MKSTTCNQQSAISLRSPASPCDRLEADTPADGRSDDAELGHQPIELRWEHGLRAVAQRVIGIAVDFNQQAVRPGCDGRTRDRRNLVAAADRMTGIDDHRQ